MKRNKINLDITAIPEILFNYQLGCLLYSVNFEFVDYKGCMRETLNCSNGLQTYWVSY